MARPAIGPSTLWQYSHSASILFAVLLFTASFLCTLLWTNGIVRTNTSVAPTATSTWSYYSPAVSTFSITYGVAIFGATWNTILFVALLILERDTLPIPTEPLRWEIEKAACIVSIAGNAIYAVACTALMAVLAQLAADATSNPDPGEGGAAAQMVQSASIDRRAGFGATAAMAGLAMAAAMWACVMDVLHARNSRHRLNVTEPLRSGKDA